MDEKTGQTAFDHSAYSNHGTAYGAVPTGLGWVFDGDDYIDCGSDESLDIIDEITIEAWVKTSNSSRQSIVTKTYGGDSPPQNYHLGLDPFAYFEHYDGGWHSYHGAKDVCDGEWHHIVAVVKSGCWWKIYVEFS